METKPASQSSPGDLSEVWEVQGLGTGNAAFGSHADHFERALPTDPIGDLKQPPHDVSGVLASHCPARGGTGCLGWCGWLDVEPGRWWLH